jgi:hypothetical protein
MQLKKRFKRFSIHTLETKLKQDMKSGLFQHKAISITCPFDVRKEHFYGEKQVVQYLLTGLSFLSAKCSGDPNINFRSTERFRRAAVSQLDFEVRMTDSNIARFVERIKLLFCQSLHLGEVQEVLFWDQEYSSSLLLPFHLTLLQSHSLSIGATLS